MSEIGDDILNYELGDEELIAGDEDDLLLSDEESETISKQQEATLLDENEEWVSLNLARASSASISSKSVKEEVKDDESLVERDERISENVEEPPQTSTTEQIVDNETNITEVYVEQKIEMLPIPVRPEESPAIERFLDPTTNVVTSSQEDSSVRSDATESERIAGSTTSLTMSTMNTTLSTEEEFEIGTEISASGTEFEDDEREERRNPKHAVERDGSFSPEDDQKRVVPHGQRQGNGPPMHRSPGAGPANRGGRNFGNSRPGYHPRNQYPPQHPLNHSAMGQIPQHPSFPAAYINQNPDFRPGMHPQHSNMGMEYGGGPQFMPRGGPPRMEMMNGPYNTPYNPVILRPGINNAGGRMMHPRFDQMRPRQPIQGHLGHQFVPNMQMRPQGGSGLHSIPMHPNAMPPQQHSHQPTVPAPPIIPRKILINPNFKHSQHVLENIINPHYLSGPVPSAQSDDELLRQQEEFINKNRMQIEKRRHERSPSPPDRERSPPRRRYSRERDYDNNGRNNTRRRGRPGERYSNPKRRRSESQEKEGAPVVEEDEETRKYRIEIEKQKAMREKFLREKEESRKRKAEAKSKSLIPEKKTAPDEPTSVKPIVVGERRIISLKKKSNEPPTIQRSVIPTAKITPATKSTTAVVKPQQKKHVPELDFDTECYDEIEGEDDLLNEDFDEDELLAESPTEKIAPSFPETFKSRRIVLKPSAELNIPGKSSSSSVQAVKKPSSSVEVVTTKPKGKGIFDRLSEKRVGAVGSGVMSEATKKTIHRIVINNSNE